MIKPNTFLADLGIQAGDTLVHVDGKDPAQRLGMLLERPLENMTIQRDSKEHLIKNGCDR